MAGSVDLSFSDTPTSRSSSSTSSPTRPSSQSVSEEYSLGLIAGGRPDRSICVWNPRKLISPEEQNDAFVARLNKHEGLVYGLEFSTLSPNLLASGADEGKVCIWDLADPSEPNHFPSLKGLIT